MHQLTLISVTVNNKFAEQILTLLAAAVQPTDEWYQDAHPSVTISDGEDYFTISFSISSIRI